MTNEQLNKEAKNISIGTKLYREIRNNNKTEIEELTVSKIGKKFFTQKN